MNLRKRSQLIHAIDAPRRPNMAFKASSMAAAGNAIAPDAPLLMHSIADVISRTHAIYRSPRTHKKNSAFTSALLHS